MCLHTHLNKMEELKGNIDMSLKLALLCSSMALIIGYHAPASFWIDAFISATYIINRLPTKVLDNKSPFEFVFGFSPYYNVFRVFPHLRDYAPHKLAPRSLECIFLGYDTQYKGYRCLDLATSRIYTTRHA